MASNGPAKHSTELPKPARSPTKVCPQPGGQWEGKKNALGHAYICDTTGSALQDIVVERIENLYGVAVDKPVAGEAVAGAMAKRQLTPMQPHGMLHNANR